MAAIAYNWNVEQEKYYSAMSYFLLRGTEFKNAYINLAKLCLNIPKPVMQYCLHTIYLES